MVIQPQVLATENQKNDLDKIVGSALLLYYLEVS